MTFGATGGRSWSLCNVGSSQTLASAPWPSRIASERGHSGRGVGDEADESCPSEPAAVDTGTAVAALALRWLAAPLEATGGEPKMARLRSEAPAAKDRNTRVARPDS